jgi:hypothetical protein
VFGPVKGLRRVAFSTTPAYLKSLVSHHLAVTTPLPPKRRGYWVAFMERSQLKNKRSLSKRRGFKK